MKQHRDRYDHQDDATLVASVLAGEREAFDILLARYSSSVQSLCTALLGNAFEAQDIAQEASLQAFLGLARLQEPARFAAWFHAIAANLARSALRRHRECALSRLRDDAMREVLWIDASPTLEEHQMLREIHETILQALLRVRGERRVHAQPPGDCRTPRRHSAHGEGRPQARLS